MTNASISLLVATSCCLFFGGKRASTLESDDTHPRRHAHADVGGSTLQLLVLGGGREHGHARVATILVGHRRTPTAILPGGGSPASFWPGTHGLSISIRSSRSSQPRGTSDPLSMVMLTPHNNHRSTGRVPFPPHHARGARASDRQTRRHPPARRALRRAVSVRERERADVPRRRRRRDLHVPDFETRRRRYSTRRPSCSGWPGRAP